MSLTDLGSLKVGETFSDGSGLVWERQGHGGPGFRYPMHWLQTYIAGQTVRIVPQLGPLPQRWAVERLQRGAWHQISDQESSSAARRFVAEMATARQQA